MVNKTYICDRFGGEKPEHVAVNVNTLNKTIRDVGWITLRSRSGFKRELDLCESCMKELADWFDNSQESQRLK